MSLTEDLLMSLKTDIKGVYKEQKIQGEAIVRIEAKFETQDKNISDVKDIATSNADRIKSLEVANEVRAEASKLLARRNLKETKKNKEAIMSMGDLMERAMPWINRGLIVGSVLAGIGIAIYQAINSAL